jgi:adenylate kinase
MRRGELVPDEMVLQILRLELDRVAVEGRAVLLDGYPRTVAQARELDRYLQIHAVVSLDIPHEVYFHFTIPVIII